MGGVCVDVLEDAGTLGFHGKVSQNDYVSGTICIVCFLLGKFLCEGTLRRNYDMLARSYSLCLVPIHSFFRFYVAGLERTLFVTSTIE